MISYLINLQESFLGAEMALLFYCWLHRDWSADSFSITAWQRTVWQQAVGFSRIEENTCEKLTHTLKLFFLVQKKKNKHVYFFHKSLKPAHRSRKFFSFFRMPENSLGSAENSTVCTAWQSATTQCVVRSVYLCRALGCVYI